jgi:hypothetical protein
MYSFHASASAYMEFWNESYSSGLTLSRRQVWQAFVQESIRSIASSSDANLTLQDGLDINDVVTEAFSILGENGVIRSANGHECSDCTHIYKSTADIIPLAGDDPAAVIGIDEHRNVPALDGAGADLALRDAARARQRIANRQLAGDDEEEEDVNMTPVRMVVVDGIVMGHQVSISQDLFECHH